MILGRPIQLLIIEDDIDYVDIIRMCLDEPDSMGLKFELERADRLEVGLKLLDTARFDALLLDLTLPDSRGIETVKRVLDHGAEIPILVMTNLGDESMAFEAMRLGAQDYMVKATSDSRLLKRAIWYAIERRKLLSQAEGVIKRSPDGMVVIDAKGVQYVNPAAERILGQTAPELVGKPFRFDAAPGQTTQQLLTGPQGERTVELVVTEIQWRGDKAMLAALHDITELQRVEQLKAEIRERRRLDQLKDQLIGTVSHELRTPLTIVKGAIDNLREGIVGELKPKQTEVVQLAHRNIARLAKMINNLLDLSRLESGQAKAHRRRLAVEPFLRELAGDFELKAKEKGLRLELDAAPGLPDVSADPELIAEVFVNLLDNALRYAKSRVTLRARLSLEAPGRGVAFDVDDDGPGIPADKVNDLFNKFVQINRKMGGSGYKGTGLGLAICKEIVGLHQSKISIHSVPGLGTRFTFSLAQFETAPNAAPARGGKEGARP